LGGKQAKGRDQDLRCGSFTAHQPDHLPSIVSYSTSAERWGVYHLKTERHKDLQLSTFPPHPISYHVFKNRHWLRFPPPRERDQQRSAW
jgi:hypothetical protein